MNKKVLRNRAYLMSHSFNRTKMFHSKRGWMLSSALFLATLGTLMGAGAVNKLPQQTVAPINDVVTKANNLFGNITANADATSGANKPSLNTQSATSASQANSSISSASAKSVAPSASNKVVSGSSSASSVNSSSANKVNNKASGNQTVSPFSASAKSSVNSSSSNKPVVHMLGLGNPLDASAPKAIQQASDNHWIYNNGNYISDNQAGQWKTNKELTQPNYYGLTWKYNEANKAIEFTSGTLTWNGSNWQGFYDEPTTPSIIKNANSIKFNDIDTNNLTNTTSMFMNDNNLKSLDFGNKFNVNNVTDMHHMFCNTQNLEYLNVSAFNTSQVRNMWSMFIGNHSLKKLDLGDNFDTSNVRNMNKMFSDELSLPKLNLGTKFNTSNVNNMAHMFDSDYALTNLNLGNKFNTNRVSDMYEMFIRDGIHSNGLNLNVGNNFNTSKAIKTNNVSDGAGHNNKNGLDNMFQYANIKSLTIPSGANFILTTHTNLKPLYKSSNIKDNKGNLYTTGNPIDFTKPEVGTFYEQNIKPFTYQYSDIYHTFDNMNAPTETTGTTKPTTSPNNWQFVNKEGQVSNTPITDANGKIMVAPSFHGMTYKYDKANQSLEFVSGVANTDLSWFLPQAPNYIKNAHSITFDDVDTSHVVNMQGMLQSDYQLTNLNLGNHFDTYNVRNMSHMFCNETNNQLLDLSQLNTSNVSNMSNMFNGFASSFNTDGANIKLGYDFTTQKVNDMDDMFNNTHFHSINISSTSTKFNANSHLGSSWYPVEKGTDYTVPNAPKTNLMDNNSHTGTWVKTPNVQKVNDTVAFTDSKTGDLVGSTTANGALDSNYTINKAPAGYSFVDKDNQITITDPSKKVTVKVSKNSNATDNANKDIPVAPTQDTDTIDYQYNGNTKGSQQFSGNDQNAKDAGDNSIDITSTTKGLNLSAGYQLVNKDNSVPYDNGTHNVAITPIQQTDNIQFMNNGQQVGTTTTKGNDSRTGINGNSTATLPTGYQLAKNASASVANDGQTHQINVTPVQKTDTVDYQLDGVTKGSHQFTGNDVQANGATETSFDVNNANDPDIPQGYQLVNGDNRFSYDGGTHDVAIEATDQSAKVNYNLPNGTTINTGSISGTVNTSTKPTKAPQGYHFSGTVNPYTFTPANAGNNPSDNVTVAPNTYNGTATLHIRYDLGNGDIVNGSDQHFNVSGQYGQSDMVISSTKYCPMNDAYKDHNANWLINFNDLTKNGNVSNDNSLQHTFTYNATEAPSLVVRYDLINPSNNDSVVKKDIHDDTFTAQQLDIKPQDWVDGNTITLGTKQSNNDTNKLDVINAPAGYHLVDNANGYDYKNATESIQLEPNANVSGHSVVLMSMPMFFHKSNKPVTPVKPSSTSNNPTSTNNNSGSASIAPSSTSSVAPSSASQSTSTSTTSTNNNDVLPSSNSSVNSDTNPVISTPTSASNASTNSGSNSDTTILPSSNTNHSIQPSSDNTSKKNSDTSDSIQTNNNIPANTNVTKSNIPTSTNVTTPNANSSFELPNTPITINPSEPINNAVSVPSIQSNSTNSNTSSKLPQTNEVNNYVGIMALATSILSLGLAGIDLKRKYSL